ncbi:MAG: hypothetical protein JO089_03665 [Alphaproteobacteria bacterium]|nr:hypothetical protein [Alphaproteobacteria bacterium]
MDKKSSRIVDAAREILKTCGYFVDNLWHINDIQFLCEQSGFRRLTAEEAMTVFEIANVNFDGEYGICWPQLEVALRQYMADQESAMPRERALEAQTACHAG